MFREPRYSPPPGAWGALNSERAKSSRRGENAPSATVCKCGVVRGHACTRYHHEQRARRVSAPNATFELIRLRPHLPRWAGHTYGEEVHSSWHHGERQVLRRHRNSRYLRGDHDQRSTWSSLLSQSTTCLLLGKDGDAPRCMYTVSICISRDYPCGHTRLGQNRRRGSHIPMCASAQVGARRRERAQVWL